MSEIIKGFEYDPDYTDRHELIKKCVRLSRERVNNTIFCLETGCIRMQEDYGDGHSTRAIMNVLETPKIGALYSVEIDRNHIQTCMEVVGHKTNLFYINCESIRYISSLPPMGLYHFAYLDSEESKEHGFVEFLETVLRMYNSGVILIDNAGHDDCPDGKKGVLIQEFLKEIDKAFLTYLKMSHGGMMLLDIDNDLRRNCVSKLQELHEKQG